MALLHQAELRPSKLELVRAWAPAQAWFTSAVDFETIAAFRFDDPAGEVGIETLIVRGSDGVVAQIPVTYRGAPLEGAESSLIGTTKHSVLGERWVYDGAGDPVYLAVTATQVRTGGHQAELLIEIDGEMVTREPTALVSGLGSGDAVEPAAVADIAIVHSGGLSTSTADGVTLSIVRYPTAEVVDGDQLAATWAAQPQPVALVIVAK